MAKRSIKDSVNDAAFAFVKGGFEEPPRTNLVTMPKNEEAPTKPTEQKPKPPKKAKAKPEPTLNKPKAAKKKTPESDHLVSVSTRMRSGLFADLKKEALLRQLANESPNSLQEILTEAAEDWLKRNAI